MKSIKYILFGIVIILAAYPFSAAYSALSYAIVIFGVFFAILGLFLPEKEQQGKKDEQGKN